MSGSGKGFPWKFALYLAITLYLIADLYWFEGPLKRKIEQRQPFTKYALQRAQENGWVATVNNVPITGERLDRAVEVFLFRRGLSAEDLPEASLRITRRAVLQELINDELVKHQAKAEGFHLAAGDREAAIERFEAQFADADSLAARAEAQGLSAEAWEEEVVRLATEHAWLEHRIAEAVEVSEEEAREWYEQNRESGEGFSVETALRARHLFLSTLKGDTPQHEQQMRDWHTRLVGGQATLEQLAREHSEDRRTAPRGGDLGWFTRKRMPEAFFDQVAALRPGELSEPFRSSLGWHIVRLEDRQLARECTFEELKPEILAWYESEKRRFVVDLFMRKLRAFGVIEIFPDNL